MRPVESSRLWASFDRAVFDCGAVMRGSDINEKIRATIHLQTLLEDLYAFVRDIVRDRA